MFKKIALIVLFVGVTVGVAYLLFRFFFAGAPTAQPPVTGGGTTTTGGLPTAGTGRPTGGTVTPPIGLPTAPGAAPGAAAPGGAPTPPQQVSADITIAPHAGADGTLNYYDQTDGHFYRLLPDGTKQVLSSQTFAAASDVVWSPKNDKAVLEFPDGSKALYDFTLQKQVTIPSHWQDPTFNGDGSAIIAKSMALDPDNRWLVSMSADGATTKLLAPLGENGDKVTVSVSPDSAIVAFSNTGDPVGFDTRDLLPIGQNGENYPALRVEGFGFTPQWSPDNQHLLYSTASQQDAYQPTLWFQVANGNDIGAGRVNLGVHTWADKCTFAGADTAYCAVPVSLPDGAGLQRDIANGTNDNIVRIDLKSGTTRTVDQPSIGTIDHVTVSSDGSTLYMGTADGHLTQVKLP